MNERANAATVQGTEHWTHKGDVRLFLWRKSAVERRDAKGTILFVHGSSMASQPTLICTCPAGLIHRRWTGLRRAASTPGAWTTRATDARTNIARSTATLRTAPRPRGRHRIHPADDRRVKAPGLRYLVGSAESCALHCAYPERVARLALDAFVWTGEGSPTLAERRKMLPEFQSKHRRPIDRAFVHSIFDRDHPGTADEATIHAFADAILALDDSVPTGTYVDMCSKLPLVDPAKITVPTIIMRGEFDGIAGFDDLIEFYKRPPNPDKQFAVMAGIAHASFQQKNYRTVYHILHAFFTQPEPVYHA